MTDSETTNQDYNIDFERIKELISKYEEIKRLGEIKRYNEESTKKDFILPLFEALGWNVYNRGKRDNSISAEETISKKRVDYGFRINGIPKFFLEAKSLKEENIQNNPKYITQAIDYAWMKSCSWAILTNFETIAVYNADWKESNYGNNLFFVLHPNDFLNDSRFVYLSKKAFENEELDKIALKYGKKQLKNSINKQLLLDMIHFREVLSKDVVKNNQDKHLTQDDIDEAVQRILDRLIFIRNAEDREMEENRLLSNVKQWSQKGKGNLIKEISSVYKYYDDQYNSKLFAHHLCDDLYIDNEALQEVIEGLNYSKDNSYRYDFSIIESDVLGNIYEQYLGNILKSTPKRAKLEESKTHRKEQGIYYTPSYIVDYIVKNTVGEYIKTHTPEEIKKVRILDPACGSGSLLIRAYKELENYWKQNSDFAQLTLDSEEFYSKKVEILKNNIFGVDLDPKAVEIAQLNLLLQISEKGEKLPLLQSNIKVGNSLIDDPNLAGDKAFKWNEEFAEIMNNGGFDVIVGNPPYGIIFDENEKQFIEENLPTFKRNNDQYVAFIEKAINLLKIGGLFSFIIPNTYLRGAYFDSLKKTILSKTKIVKIIDFGTNHVFKDPSVFNSIIILQRESDEIKREKNKLEFFYIPKLDGLHLLKLENASIKTKINQIQFNDLIWKPKNNIIEKINKRKSTILGEICYVKDVGFNYWTVGRGKKRGNSIGSRVFYDGEKKNPKDIPYLKGRDISRYGYVFGNHWLRHDYKRFLDEKRDVFRFSSKFLETSPKIIYRQTSDRIIATLDNNKYYLDKTVHLVVPKQNKKVNMFYLLGLLNSKLISYFYIDLVHEGGRTFAQVKTIYVKKIPIIYNTELENKISELVMKELEFTKKLNDIGDKKTDQQANILNSIEKLDAEIDEFVYKLYGITEEEKKIIEESLR